MCLGLMELSPPKFAPPIFSPQSFAGFNFLRGPRRPLPLCVKAVSSGRSNVFSDFVFLLGYAVRFIPDDLKFIL
jgi:hypothetical protein